MVTPPANRKIIHIDMDAFYASVEIRDNPSLKGKPVVVGGSPESRAVVCAASYEARKFGIRSAMSCAEAKRRCPHAVFLPPRFGAYTEASEQVMKILTSVTDLVEPLSLDEAYLDVTENKWAEKSATKVAERIRAEIHAQTKLTASAGVSYNKFLAKIASDLDKPDGLFVIAPKDVDNILPGLPVEKLWGVGKKTKEVLNQHGYFKVADLTASTEEKLEQTLGSMGTWLWELSHGRDDREVDASWDPKSSGSEETFDKDITDLNQLIRYLEEIAHDVSDSLKSHNWYAFTFTLKVKYFDFKQITRSTTLTIPTDDYRMILDRMTYLLVEKTEAGTTAIRLLGISASGLVRENDPLQLYFEFMKDL